MLQGGFLDTPRRSPAGLTFVIALHGAALTALILSPPELITKRINSIGMYNVKEKPAPPPEPDKLEPKPDTPARARVTPPDRVVETAEADVTGLVREAPDPIRPLFGEGTGVDPVIIRPEPVFTDAVTDPRYAEAFQPPYPPSMVRQEIEGKAIVRVLIGADGRVRQVEPVSATDPAFLEATRRQALRHWRFRPATRDGVPIESWRTMTVRFEMNA